MRPRIWSDYCFEKDARVVIWVSSETCAWHIYRLSRPGESLTRAKVGDPCLKYALMFKELYDWSNLHNQTERKRFPSKKRSRFLNISELLSSATIIDTDLRPGTACLELKRYTEGQRSSSILRVFSALYLSFPTVHTHNRGKKYELITKYPYSIVTKKDRRYTPLISDQRPLSMRILRCP